jgi:hypothetical protein
MMCDAKALICSTAAGSAMIASSKLTSPLCVTHIAWSWLNPVFSQ